MLYNTIILSALLITQLLAKGPCDEKLECYQKVFGASDRALCTGFKSCARAEFGTTDYNPICAGAASCAYSSITTPPAKVLCNGFESCFGVFRGLEATEKIACNGLKACREITGKLQAPQVTCDGCIACNNKKIYATGLVPAGEVNSVRCNGKKSCVGSRLISDNRVDCDGDSTCKDADIEANQIGCQGKRGCYDSNMIGPAKVYGYGFLGAAKAMITGPDQGKKSKKKWTFEVRMLGMNSGLFSTIKTGGATTTILGYGYRSLVGASIRCTDGSLCKLTCRLNACKSAQVFVDRKSSLEIDPIQCDPRDASFVGYSKKYPTLPAKALGIHCPSITIPGVTVTDDADIIGLAEKFEAERVNDPDYIEMEESTKAAQEALDAMINEQVETYENYLDLTIPEGMVELTEDESELMVVGNLFTANDGGAISNVLTSNLLTALIVFIMTCIGSICYIAYKYEDKYSGKAFISLS